MAGTLAGGKKAAETNKQRYGAEFYKSIGSTGGQAKVPKGFAVNRELAKRAGQIGGKISRRSGKQDESTR
jgi:general stress protein YciG